MLLEFSVKNYKVFKDQATLSLVASNYDRSTLEEHNVWTSEEQKLRVLKSAVLYGANASGKTKFFEALDFFRRFVRKSSKEGQKGEPIAVQPFLLSESTEYKSSEFEIVFLHQGAIYRYGFEATREVVLAEWLFYKPKSREYQIFYRDTVSGNVQTHKTYFKKGNFIVEENLIRDNALLLSVASQFNDETCSRVMDWFNNGLAILSCLHESGYRGFSLMKTDDADSHNHILDMVKRADLSIQDIKAETLSVDQIPNDLPEDMRQTLLERIQQDHAKIYTEASTIHHKYDAGNRIVGSAIFSMDKEESHGTRKFFYLTGPILDSLENGKTLFIDELDARLHPNLVQRVFSLFNSPVTNKFGAQVVVTSHNTSLLRNDVLRKDQVWFVEKDKFEAAHLYSLADFKSSHVRNSENYEANYLKGKYGATPYLRDFNGWFEHV